MRRVQKEERQARERGEPLDDDGMAADGQSGFRSGTAWALMEMGRSQNNRGLYRKVNDIFILIDICVV